MQKKFKKLALGLGGLGLTLGVSSAVASKASGGTAASGMMSGFPIIASGAGIATTAIAGHAVLKQVKKLKY
jgi:hypothetical protein